MSISGGAEVPPGCEAAVVIENISDGLPGGTSLLAADVSPSGERPYGAAGAGAISSSSALDLPPRTSHPTNFSRSLAQTTMHAPDRLAENLIERLQKCCLDEAHLGRSSFVWDSPLPGGRRLSDSVARSFAAQLKELCFLRVEWWSGKDWKDIPGRYCIIHDPMYDKYNLRIRVRWPEAAEDEVSCPRGSSDLRPSHRRNGSQPASRLEPGVEPARASRRDAAAVEEQDGHPLPEPALARVLQQLQEVVALQQKLLVQSAAAQAAAEKRAARAEARALAAERLCLEKLHGTAGAPPWLELSVEPAHAERLAKPAVAAEDARTIDDCDEETPWSELCGV